MVTTNITLTESDLLSSPAWLPLRQTSRELEFVRLDEPAYRAASFLDERLLHPAPTPGGCSRLVWQAAASRLPACRRFIFHTGHVGSTLLSRLIGEHSAFFSLREPAILRATALMSASPKDPETATLEELAHLLSRTWRKDQEAVIKTTSILNESANTLLGFDQDSRAILMWAQPLNYIRSILAGPNSRIETQTLAPLRLGRLMRRIEDPDLRPRTDGEQVAMSWLSEMLTLHETAEGCRSQTLWMDFDWFLKSPTAHLSAVFQFLGANPGDAKVAALVGGPIMGRYSKAPEHAYDAALRIEVLQSADWTHGEEIRRGMAWLDRVFGFSAAARALVRSVPL